ncbi:hypothetical protein M758_3G153100 [Ceratodon purpureus]|nr:hypothetical protein M758_3G153100 [Ceratodon purpureus]
MGITSPAGEDGHGGGEPAEPMPFKFVAWGGSADVSFWHRLADFKLDTQKLTEEPVNISGFFAPCNQPHAPSYLQLMMESLPPDPGVNDGPIEVPYNRNRLPVPGTLHNTNTVETYNALDKPALLRSAADKIWDDIKSGRAEEDCSLLSRFLVVSYADLKKWTFTYRFAFPGLRMSPQATAASCQPACDFFTKDEAAGVLAACTEWRALPSGASLTSFLLNITPDAKVKAQSLKEWHDAQHEGGKVILAFYDPSNLPANPGWPLRNLLALASVRWGVTRLQVLCYRENRSGLLDLEHSPVLDIILPETPEWKEPVGWELTARGGKGSKFVDLGQSMDPVKLAESAADLNLKLMRWRLLPSLDLPRMASTKCLLLGAGTLGCQVARTLMAWGMRHITLLDYGRVALSNPLRQSLFTHEDSLNNGKVKAEAAAENLKRIFPGVNATGVQMSIPMPGHPVSSNEEAGVLNDIQRMKELVDEHDVVFLLTDTRESRWLPTLLCADANKVAINAALGFDTYLVMRHGASPLLDSDSTSDEAKSRLGCYFCNDVVAPLDSTANRTLDQQCTVTRPGLAPIAAALAVELAVALLHHPLGVLAPADQGTSLTDNTEHPLGIMPHQVRGFIAHYGQLVVTGQAFDKCTACSSTVVNEFRERGSDFVLEVLNRPNYLEDLTGLTELLAATDEGGDLVWDDELEDTDL